MAESTSPENTGSQVVLYEDLAEIERKFEDVEVGLLRQNYTLTWPIFAERAKLVEKIPHFWAIVAEEAPEEVDRFIQPCDTDVLSSLQTISVTRFEVSLNAPDVGEPRSVKIRFSFRENAWFEDQVLEKTFWYRCGRTGWTGLVSEPVRIHWKEGKDLTEGLLESACRVFEIATEIKKIEAQIGKDSRTEQGMQDKLNERKTLHQSLVEGLDHKLKSAPQDAISFFAWFGYRGRNVGAEESAAVTKELINRRRHLKSENEMTDGREVKSVAPNGMALDGADEYGLGHEIFPAGEELAVAISDDLYPGAIKYFTQAQEKDAVEFSDEEEEEEGVSDSESESSVASDAPVTKKRKTSA